MGQNFSRELSNSKTEIKKTVVDEEIYQQCISENTPSLTNGVDIILQNCNKVEV